MSKAQNPFGLHTVTPYLMVDDAPKVIEFIKSVFKAEIRGDISYRDDGNVQHVELKVGDSIIMLGGSLPDFPANQVGLYVYVEDCDLTYTKALDEGATKVMEPTNFPHGDRYGSVKDMAGNMWHIVSHIGDQD